jgi:4-amino-4-deoxy-L-arabinose transferase-like glycosyltransferase
MPCWDTAAHRLNSFLVYDLLKHPDLGSIDWYKRIFSVSPLYPPFFYFINGVLKVICGELFPTDELCEIFFVALLFSSVYGIAKLSYKDHISAPLAATMVFLCPLTFWSTHSILLDSPANAMIALGLCTFLWWTDNPTKVRSLALGSAFGLAFLTKSNTAAYFFGPVAIECISVLRNRDLLRSKQLLLALTVSTTVILPWVVFAGPTVSQYVASIQQQDFGMHDRVVDFFDNLRLYGFVDMPTSVLTPLFYGAMIFAFLRMKTIGRNQIYLLASGVSAIIICSAFRWLHSSRYIVPITIPVAILTAHLFAEMWTSHKIIQRTMLFGIALIAISQFVYFGFTPYPLRLPKPLNKFLRVVSGNWDRFHYEHQGVSLHPLPYADWRALWVISLVEHLSDHSPTTLIVMPDSDTVGCSTYVYLTAIRKDGIKMLDCRNLAVQADIVRFDASQAATVDWYVLKTGDQGRQLADSASAAAYDQWCRFVRSSGKFSLFTSKSLPDGSILQLYINENSKNAGIHTGAVAPEVEKAKGQIK